MIKDLGRNDQIPLYGNRSDYRLGATPAGVPTGTGSFLDTPGNVDELIGVVQSITNQTLINTSLRFA